MRFTAGPLAGEVILNQAGNPDGVVHITASGTLAPDRSTFEAIGRGDVYHLAGPHTTLRGWRADRSESPAP